MNLEEIEKIAKLDINEFLNQFSASDNGLKDNEIEERRQKYGENKISYFKIDILEIIKRNTFNYFHFLLLLAFIISYLLNGISAENILILTALIFSIIISIIQDYRANKFAEKLLSYFKKYVNVKRNGKWVVLLDEDIVVGDYILVKAGDFVPADCRIIKSENLLIDESIITGESEPVFKYPRTDANNTRTDANNTRTDANNTRTDANNTRTDANEVREGWRHSSRHFAEDDSSREDSRKLAENNVRESSRENSRELAENNVTPPNIALMGTTVVQGYLEGIVFAVGKNSYFGSIAKSTLEIPKETAFKKIMDNFAKVLSYFAIFLILILIITNQIKGGVISLNELLIFSIVLAVAIVPEMMPLMTVLSLSIASLDLAKKGAIVKRLSAIEDLGTIEILCTDKTGTITQNKLELIGIKSKNESDFVYYFLIDYYLLENNNPYNLAISAKLNQNIKYENVKTLNFEPFDPIKRSEIINILKDNQNIKVIKGSPENVLNYVYENKELDDYKNWLKIFEEEDKKGLRTLALAIESNNKKEFLGLASFKDPLKETAKEAIDLAKKLNLKIKILTGDSPYVSKNVALELGLIKEDEEIITGDFIRNIEDKKLQEIAEKYTVFARMLPEDKERILKVLQKNNFVGFLGEGINDSPGLKIANVAIVVDTASDIAKELSDILLKEKDLKLIVESIKKGRETLENLGKYVKHTMSDNFGNLTAVSILTMFLNYIPLTPIQILLTNFLTDIPIVAIAKDKVDVEDIKYRVDFSPFVLFSLSLILGIVAGFINILTYLIFKNYEVDYIRSMIFFVTTMTGLLVYFSIRTKKIFIKSKPSPFSFIIVLLSVILTVIFLQVYPLNKIFGLKPIYKSHTLYILLLLAAFFIFTEIFKLIFYKIKPDAI